MQRVVIVKVKVSPISQNVCRGVRQIRANSGEHLPQFGKRSSEIGGIFLVNCWQKLQLAHSPVFAVNESSPA